MTKTPLRYHLPRSFRRDANYPQLIANCIANFNISPDKSSLSRTTSAISHLRTARSQILTKHRNALNTLSRSLAAQQSAYSLTTNTHNPAAHASDILRLDAEKFKIAKEADEAEVALDRCREDLRAAKIALEESSGDGADGGAAVSRTGAGTQREREDDEMLLKLKVYRMLGIDVERDEATDEYVRAVVRNRKRGDVSVVNVDPKFSRFFYANWFWNQL